MNKKQVIEVLQSTRGLLPWWHDFAANVLEQGFASPKQQALLDRFDLESETNKAYGTRKRKRQNWSDGLDHDDMADYTGESCSASFYS